MWNTHIRFPWFPVDPVRKSIESCERFEVRILHATTISSWPSTKRQRPVAGDPTALVHGMKHTHTHSTLRAKCQTRNSVESGNSRQHQELGFYCKYIYIYIQYCCIWLYHIKSNHIISYNILLYYIYFIIISYYIVLYYIILYYIKSYYIIWYYIILYYIILFCFI